MALYSYGPGTFLTRIRGWGTSWSSRQSKPSRAKDLLPSPSTISTTTRHILMAYITTAHMVMAYSYGRRPSKPSMANDLLPWPSTISTTIRHACRYVLTHFFLDTCPVRIRGWGLYSYGPI